MGKKRTIEKTEEAVLKEKETVEKAVARQTVKKTKTFVERGRLYIGVSYNNTAITATDEKGNVLAWVTAGSIGFKGPKKATPFAASKVAGTIVEKLQKIGLSKVEILVKGIGSGRDSVLKGLADKGLEISSVRDITSIPHNGPRPKKPRRV